MSVVKAQESPSRGSHAKVQVYEEAPGDIGGFSPSGSATEKKKRVKKFTIDHLCVDVPSEAMLREMFEFFDKDGSGAIELSEFRTVFRDSFDNFGAPMEERDVDRLFAQFDKGHKKGGVANDGKLHFEEFCVLILSRMRM